MRGAKCAHHGLRRRLVGLPPSGDDDGPGMPQRTETWTRLNDDTAGCADRAALYGANFEVVPVHAEIFPGQAKKLDDDSKLESAQAVVGQHRYAPRVSGDHGRILANIGISAYRRGAPFRTKVPALTVCVFVCAGRKVQRPQRLKPCRDEKRPFYTQTPPVCKARTSSMARYRFMIFFTIFAAAFTCTTPTRAQNNPLSTEVRSDYRIVKDFVIRAAEK